jgi:hypothetical protein
MNDAVGRFCENVHGKLETLQGRLESLRLNIGATYHFLHEKVGEMRKASEVRQLRMAEARALLDVWIQQTGVAAKNSTERETGMRDAQYLSSRARIAEACAEAALMLAEASIDDGEWMILEAIAARRDAEALTSS